MNKAFEKKSMVLEDLNMYLQDLIKMGFVYCNDKDGKLNYELTDLGKKAGLHDLPN